MHSASDPDVCFCQRRGGYIAGAFTVLTAVIWIYLEQRVSVQADQCFLNKDIVYNTLIYEFVIGFELFHIAHSRSWLLNGYWRVLMSNHCLVIQDRTAESVISLLLVKESSVSTQPWKSSMCNLRWKALLSKVTCRCLACSWINRLVFQSKKHSVMWIFSFNEKV